jgi:hypothetical protein
LPCQEIESNVGDIDRAELNAAVLEELRRPAFAVRAQVGVECSGDRTCFV